ncbi:F-box protein At5g50450-like isoform X2 [Typha angustifolia]|uniref:F-box protein At5g50450-like isoform X2 n=1 Tax=Typha angustifolia TaxID=59011 RepID=UPI003C2B2F29
MRTRSGVWYQPAGEINGRKRRRRGEEGGEARRRKLSAVGDLFDALPDDLVLSILCKLSASATRPFHLSSILLTCKRFNELGLHPLVLSKASAKSLAVRAMNWSESAHRFLNRCADAGNLEACYILGMILFYCLENRASGAALMARAAMGCHAAALYSLAVIQFNGSGGSKDDKDLRGGAALCARSAALGHVDALRELGHCLQDGYGVRRSVAAGRRLLLQANARELAAAGGGEPAARHDRRHLLSDFGCHVATVEGHAANRFMAEWFAGKEEDAEGEGDGRRLCSHVGCGRRETRRHEFRRCSVCGIVNYCSRACQAMHWKMVHKAECAPMERWIEPAVVVGGAPHHPDGHVEVGDLVPLTVATREPFGLRQIQILNWSSIKFSLLLRRRLVQRVIY